MERRQHKESIPAGQFKGRRGREISRRGSNVLRLWPQLLLVLANEEMIVPMAAPKPIPMPKPIPIPNPILCITTPNAVPTAGSNANADTDAYDQRPAISLFLFHTST